VTNVLEVDVDAVLQAWLNADLTGVRVGTVTPADPNGTLTWLPFVQHYRIGGGDDGYALDAPMIAMHGFAGTQFAANGLLYQARASLRRARGVVIDGAVITSIRTIGGPSWAPNTNPAVRHSAATFQLQIKTA
jgi:hypothetical protein